MTEIKKANIVTTKAKNMKSWVLPSIVKHWKNW